MNLTHFRVALFCVEVCTQAYGVRGRGRWLPAPIAGTSSGGWIVLTQTLGAFNAQNARQVGGWLPRGVCGGDIREPAAARHMCMHVRGGFRTSAGTVLSLAGSYSTGGAAQKQRCSTLAANADTNGNRFAASVPIKTATHTPDPRLRSHTHSKTHAHAPHTCTGTDRLVVECVRELLTRVPAQLCW